MASAIGFEVGPEEKARAFGEYLEEIRLPAEQVLGDIGPAEVGDVISFFYAGMPDRFKAAVPDDSPASGHEAEPMPAEQWCAAMWEAQPRAHEPPERAA